MKRPFSPPAVALGACVVEKHFTLDRNLQGNELKMSVQEIRVVEDALGHGRKEPSSGERDMAAVARRSLVAARDIPAGSTLT